MDTSIVTAVIAALAAIAVACIQFKAAKTAKINAERQQDAFKFQLECGNLIIAIGELSYVTSLAVTGGHTNGNVEAAQKGYKQALASYEKIKEELARKWIVPR